MNFARCRASIWLCRSTIWNPPTIRARGHPGNFRATMETMRTAKLSGFHVCVETRIFADTDRANSCATWQTALPSWTSMAGYKARHTIDGANFPSQASKRPRATDSQPPVENFFGAPGCDIRRSTSLENKRPANPRFKKSRCATRDRKGNSSEAPKKDCALYDYARHRRGRFFG